MAFAVILDVFLLYIKTCYSYAFDVSCNLSLYNVCEYVYKKFVCIIVLSSRDTVVFINSMIKKIAMKSASVSILQMPRSRIILYKITSSGNSIYSIHSIDHFVSIVFISVLFLIRSWKHQVVGTKIWKTSWDLILTFLSREA